MAIAGIDGKTILRLSGRILEGQIRTAQTDTIHLPIQPPPERFTRIKQREPDAGRATVYGQNRIGPAACLQGVGVYGQLRWAG